MLHHRLATAERPGDGGDAALGDGKERVYDALPRDHGHIGSHFFAVRPPLSDGPALQHTDLALALFGGNDGDRLRDIEIAFFDSDDLTLNAVRHHDLMRDDGRFLYGTQKIAALHFVAGLYARLEPPDLLMIEIGHGNAAGDAVAVRFKNAFQRPLYPVENFADDARREFHRQRRARALHFFPGT